MMETAKLHSPQGLFQRYENNPILTTGNWPYPANSVFNPGAVRFKGKILLLVRVEDLCGMSHFTVATSRDGLTDWRVDETPTMTADPENHPEELWGIEDARVVYLEELGKYAITYTAYSRGGPLVALAFTHDFRRFERCGAILPTENKDASVLPRRVGDRWVLLHRPVPSGSVGTHMWIAYSPDLVHWGQHEIIMEARSGGWWDSNKIGLGPQPIETADGWLVIYHGVRDTASGSIYRVGLALLDLDEPHKVVRRSEQWVLGPTEPYERVGDVGHATFPCGAVADNDSGKLYLYYGVADTSVAVAVASIQDLLDFLKNDK